MGAIRHKVLLAAVAMLIGWFLGAPADSTQALVQARRDVWQLQALPSPADATTRAVIVATSPQWGTDQAAASADAAPAEQLRWRMAGVFGSGKNGGVLVLYDGDRKPPERLKVGEKLPSGHMIEAVDGNQVCIRIGKKLYSFGVENRE